MLASHLRSPVSVLIPWRIQYPFLTRSLTRSQSWKKERAQKKAAPLMPLKQSVVQRPQLRGVVFTESVVGKQLNAKSELGLGLVKMVSKQLDAKSELGFGFGG